MRTLASPAPGAPGAPGAVPVDLPDPFAVPVPALAEVLLAMAAESSRLQRLFSGRGTDDRQSADLEAAREAGDLAGLWRGVVLEVCAAHRVAAVSAGEAADRSEDDVFGSLSALCTHLMSWLSWCSRLPFASPTTLPDGQPTLAYRYAARCGEPARLAVAAFVEVIAARRWPPARRGDVDGGHARGR